MSRTARDSAMSRGRRSPRGSAGGAATGSAGSTLSLLTMSLRGTYWPYTCEDRDTAPQRREEGPMPAARVPQDLDRNIALDLVRVTEAAAMAAGRWVGRGDKNGGDGAAVDAMRKLINSIQMRGTVVIGEGEKDEAPMLFNGEEVGDGTGPEVDVAVDPVDGTTLMSKGMPGAVAVLAVAERGAMF